MFDHILLSLPIHYPSYFLMHFEVVDASTLSPKHFNTYPFNYSLVLVCSSFLFFLLSNLCTIKCTEFTCAVPVNFVFGLTGTQGGQIKHDFWVCLGGCFSVRLALELMG